MTLVAEIRGKAGLEWESSCPSGFLGKLQRQVRAVVNRHVFSRPGSADPRGCCFPYNVAIRNLAARHQGPRQGQVRCPGWVLGC